LATLRGAVELVDEGLDLGEYLRGGADDQRVGGGVGLDVDGRGAPDFLRATGVLIGEHARNGLGIGGADLDELEGRELGRLDGIEAADELGDDLVLEGLGGDEDGVGRLDGLEGGLGRGAPGLVGEDLGNLGREHAEDVGGFDILKVDEAGGALGRAEALGLVEQVGEAVHADGVGGDEQVAGGGIEGIGDGADLIGLKAVGELLEEFVGAIDRFDRIRCAESNDSELQSARLLLIEHFYELVQYRELVRAGADQQRIELVDRGDFGWLVARCVV